MATVIWYIPVILFVAVFLIKFIVALTRWLSRDEKEYRGFDRKGIMVMPTKPAEPIDILDHVGGPPFPQPVLVHLDEIDTRDRIVGSEETPREWEIKLEWIRKLLDEEGMSDRLADRWLYSSNRAFGGRNPIEALEAGMFDRVAETARAFCAGRPPPPPEPGPPEPPRPPRHRPVS